MTEKREIEIFVMMDADGDVAVGFDQDEVEANFTENVGGCTYPVRIASFKVRMARPAVEDGPSIDIPDTAGTTEQIEVEAA